MQLGRETETGGLQKGLGMKGTVLLSIGPLTLLPSKSWCGIPWEHQEHQEHLEYLGLSLQTSLETWN